MGRLFCPWRSRRVCARAVRQTPFLGGGIQTCRKLIDDGWIGEPVAAAAFMVGHGHEGWHPNPDFYYKFGGGPMFGMGPYYLIALVSLLGPVRRVTGSTRASFLQRVITNPENRTGKRIDVEIPIHITGVMDFASGAVGTIDLLRRVESQPAVHRDLRL